VPELQDDQDRQREAKSNTATLEDFLQSDSFADHLRQILPDHLSSDRFSTIALRQTRAIPELQYCDLSTVAASVMEAAGLGLEIGINGECWVIPRQIKRKVSGEWTKVWEAGLQVGYLGHLALAWRSSQVAGLTVDVVIDGDRFEFEKGTSGFLRHRQREGRIVSEATVTHAYTVVQTVYGGTVWDVIDKVEIERIRNSGPSSNSPAWRDWYDQMAQGKVMKRALKFCPKSPELARAISLDDQMDGGVRQTFTQSLPAIPASVTSSTVSDTEEALRRSAATQKEGGRAPEEPPPAGDEVPPMEEDQREPVPVTEQAQREEGKATVGDYGF